MQRRPAGFRVKPGMTGRRACTGGDGRRVAGADFRILTPIAGALNAFSCRARSLVPTARRRPRRKPRRSANGPEAGYARARRRAGRRSRPRPGAGDYGSASVPSHCGLPEPLSWKRLPPPEAVGPAVKAVMVNWWVTSTTGRPSVGRRARNSLSVASRGSRSSGSRVEGVQRRQRLDRAEAEQARGFEAAAPLAGVDPGAHDAGAREALAQFGGLAAAFGVEVALRGAVVEAKARRIAVAGRGGVAQHQQPVRAWPVPRPLVRHRTGVRTTAG
jgi:hypothetical protein